ncbi:MAG TPA: hypothetical protein VGK19_09775 [Capsulimonadaceae bacterium]
MRNDSEGKEALALIVLGAAAGALATYLVQTIKSEQPAAVNGTAGASVGEWFRDAANKLQAGRDKIVEAIEKSQSS